VVDGAGAELGRDEDVHVVQDGPVVEGFGALLRVEGLAIGAGGIGVRLGPVVPALRAAIEKGLTNIARPGWTLAAGDGDFHSAAGAARLAARGGWRQGNGVWR
jgi:hypothetical protein